jgi:hypothetical protein
MKTTLEIDLHGYTSKETLDLLDEKWVSHQWDGYRRIILIHGNGNVLWRTVRDWADRNGIQWVPDMNPGLTILHPSIRTSVRRPLAKTSKIRHIPETFQKLKNIPSPPPRPSKSASKPDRNEIKKEIEQMKEAFENLDGMNIEEMKRRKYR